MSRPTTEQEWHAQELRGALARRAIDLRRMADHLDSLCTDVTRAEQTGRPYWQIADEAIDKLLWGLANLKVGRLINEAAEADVARAREEVAS